MTRGEDGIGDWTIVVMDKTKNEHSGALIDWKIALWGEAIDPEQAVLHALPGDSPNATHPLQHPLTSSAQVHTMTLSHSSTSQAPLSTASDHPERPVNSKPSLVESDKEEVAISTTDGFSSEPTSSSTEPTEADANADDSDRPQFLPSFLPTFGVSGKTQGWIYGALVIIVFFISGVACYLCVQRRKRGVKSNSYEFAVLEDEEEGDVVVAGGSSRRRTAGGSGRRKARELYDAFGASDDDEEEGSYSDEDEKVHRHERDYDLEAEEEAHGIDEGRRERGGDREALLGRNRE